MLLAIDAGNSYIKYGYHDGRAWLSHDRVASADVSMLAHRLADHEAPSAVIVCNVAGNRFEQVINPLIDRWRCKSLNVSAQVQAYGVSNGYARPQQLGADRWVALVAARQLSKDSMLLVSVGTAVTVDLLSEDGTFEGGLILPGYAAMLEAISVSTAGVVVSEGKLCTKPRCTADAVHSGAIYAIAGAVEKFHRHACQDGKQREIILSGGGAPEVIEIMDPRPRLVENLVMQGLLHIARTEKLI